MRPRAVFMGTPSVAVPFLESLHRIAEIALVVSQPDRPRGRKQLPQPTPVKARAGELGIPVIQPETVRNNKGFLTTLRDCAPAVMLVVAYGRILPLEVLEIPPNGCLNIHFSLLPAYRGAAPVNWALVNGETETGVTLMQMDTGMDTGPVIGVKRTAIDPTEQAPRLFERLTEMGVHLLESTLAAYMAGTAEPVPQPLDGASKAPMMTKEDGLLDFSQPALSLHNRVRGLQPWPGTRGTVSGADFKILETGLPVDGAGEPAGTTIIRNRQLMIQCGDGRHLPVLRIQPENRKAMDAAACINGGYIQDGDHWYVS